MTPLEEVKSSFPDLAGMDDSQLAALLHRRYSPNVPFTEFADKIGLTKAEAVRNAPEGGVLPGVGMAFSRAYRGLQQLGGGDWNQQKELERRALESPLASSTAGKVGDFIGNSALVAPAMGFGIIPGAIASGALAATAPTEGEANRVKQGVVGTVGGLAAGVGGKILGAGLGMAKDAVLPFLKSGEEKVAANTLLRFAADPKSVKSTLADLSRNPAAAEIVPGSAPTLAQATGDVGLARLEKAVRNVDPSFTQDLEGRYAAQNAARMDALRGISGDASSMAKAVQDREDAAKQLYSAVRGAPVSGDEQLKILMQRPAIKEAIAQAEQNMRNRGGTPSAGGYLHEVKMALDGMIETAPQRGISAATNQAVSSARNDFLSWLENKIPDYKVARETYAKMSEPINRMQVGQEFLRRGTDSTEGKLTAARVGNALKNEEDVVRAATGQAKPLSEVLNPNELQSVRAVRADLERAQNTQNLAAARGSDTAQNLVGMNLLRNASQGLFGSRLGNALTGTGPMERLGQVISRAYNLTGAEDKARQRLMDLLLNPQSAGKALQSVSGEQQRTALARALADLAKSGVVSGGSQAALGLSP